MAKLNPILIKKLAEKTNKSEKYIREQISKKASKNNVDSAAYLVKYCKNAGIGCTVYFKKLPPDLKIQVRSLESTQKDVKQLSSQRLKVKKIVKENVVKIENIRLFPKDKFLDKRMISSALRNAELYPILYIFENSVRLFVLEVMNKRHGANWWDSKVNNTIKRLVDTRKAKEKTNPWHGKRGGHQIFYTDFKDLTIILRSNTNIFSPIFKDIEGGLDWLTRRLDEAYFSRNNIAHTVSLREQDANLFTTYFYNWYEQLDVIISKAKFLNLL